MFASGTKVFAGQYLPKDDPERPRNQGACICECFCRSTRHLAAQAVLVYVCVCVSAPVTDCAACDMALLHLVRQIGQTALSLLTT
eukprot:COSAG05_NODE_17_length_35518_cov_34.728084_28_plen_85_part_00